MSETSSPRPRPLQGRRARSGADAARYQALAPRSDRSWWPLSAGQRRLWMLDQLDRGSASYVLPAAVRLQGRIDEAILIRAFGEIVRRHEVLRAAFPERGGEPVQVVSESSAARVPVVDLTALGPEERWPAAQALVRRQAGMPFDLTAGPLVRMGLFRLGDADHLLFFSIHHIVTDGVSTSNLIRELGALYGAFAAGEPSPLAELPVQYADFAAWQNERFSGERLALELDYWRERLDGAPAVLELPTDRPRPAVRSSRGGRVRRELPGDLTRRLAEWSRERGVTLYLTLLAIAKELLARWTSERDVIVGTPVAGRVRRETQPLIGFFVNTLVLRTDLSGRSDFGELVSRVRETVRGAFAHQETPFDRVVEALRPDRTLSRTPLFQVAFALEGQAGTDLSRLHLGSVEAEILDLERGATNFDLTITAKGTRDGLALVVEYSADLFDRTTIQRLAAAYESLAAGAIGDPDRALSTFELVTGAERQQLLVEWNDTADPEPGPGIPELLRRQADLAPEAVAVVEGDRHLSYRELVRLARRGADGLRRIGVGPEVSVGLLLERSLDAVVVVLAVLEAGGTYVPLDPGNPAERLRWILDDADVSVVVAGDSERGGALDGAVPIVTPRALLTGAESGSESRAARHADAEMLAYVMYTSGSTGTPKGVAVPHRAVLRLVQGRFIQLGAAETFLLNAPLAFDASTLEIWGALLTGGRLVVAPAQTATLSELATRLTADRITTSWLTAGLFHQMVEEEVTGLRAVRQLLAGGDVLSPSHVERLLEGEPRPRLINGYGPTENTTFTCCAVVERSRNGPGTVPIGRPIAGTWVRVVDQDLRPVPLGVAGELVTGGVGLARGYRRRSALTAERFVPDPFAAGRGERLYRTGDRVRWLPDGRLEFLGRLDHQVKVRGFRIEPGEVEAALSSHPAVRESAVLAIGDGAAEKRLVAYWVPQEGAASSPDELAGHLRRSLPAHMVPSGWVSIDSLPLTPNGKLDRRKLAELSPGRAEVSGSSPPETPVEELLAGLYCTLLDLQRVGVEESFFDLGGHSLLATKLAARIRDVFDVDLTLGTVFEASSVRELARRIEALQRQGPAAPRIEAAEHPGDRPLSFAQERLWFMDRMHPGSAYNIPGAFEVSGALSPLALQQTFDEIVRRHEVLRTRFPLRDDRPAAVTEQRWTGGVSVVDLENLPPGRRRTELARRLRRASGRRFDLRRGPLLEVLLFDLEPGRQVLFLNVHHIVADGGSVDLLMQEVRTLYEALAAGRPSPLPELPLQYGDFAVWQRRWLEEGAREGMLEYWRRTLEGAPPLLELPGDRPRPAVPSYSGATFTFELPGADALLSLARRRGVTLFMLLLAGFQLLLHRLTHRRDVVVGAPIAQRPLEEVEGLIGCFINMIVLRTGIGEAMTFGDLLEAVRQVALDAYAHQDLPFELLVEELAPQRNLSYSPIFQVMFSLRGVGGGGLELPHGTLEPIGLSSGVSRFDLTLAAVERPDGLSGVFEYSKDLFDGTTVRRFANQLGTLLGQLAADPERRIADLHLLDPAQRHEVLAEWNDTARPVTCAPLHRQFEERARAMPEAVALVCGDEAWTYRELDRSADRLARRLSERGVRPGQITGIVLRRTPALPVAMLGVLKTGGAYLPLDPSYPPARLAFMVEDAGAAALVAEAATVSIVPANDRPVVLVDTAFSAQGDGSAAPRASSGRPDELAYVIYTSGSTGRPKGVMVPHRQAANFFGGMDRVLGEPQSGTWMAVTSVSFDISLLEILWTLTRGLRVVLHGGPSPDGMPGPGTEVSRAPAERVDLSLFYFAAARDDGEDSYRLLLEGARFADRHGFSAVWTPERHFHPFGGLYPNPAVTGAAVAAVTERVQIRAGSVVLPLHDPVRVAEEWAVVDRLSGGRVGISVASGWHPNDFVFQPDNYPQRKQVMFRELETVQKLWRGESITLPGGTGEPVELRIYPRPLQGELPVWVTAGGSPETFEMAGKVGANLLTHLLGQSLDELSGKIQVYRRAWDAAGHGEPRGTVSLMLHTFVADDLEVVRDRARAPFIEYLQNAAGLMKSFAKSAGLDLDTLDEEETAALLQSAFDRYFERSGLFGTPESCLAMLQRLGDMDVDEVACLIDFGIDLEETLAGLERLAEVSRRSRTRPARPALGPSPVQEMVRQRVTHLQCTPSMAAMLLADSEVEAALGRLEHLLVGGEAISSGLAERLARSLSGSLLNMYGPTETTVWSTSSQLQPDGDVTIGRPILNTGVHLLDPRMVPVPPGVPGHLFIGGSGVVRGYLGRPGLTAERFVPDPFGAPGSRLYATGDLARLRSDGRIEFSGRIDHQLKIRGHRIEPSEIEVALQQSPSVREAVVVAREVSGDRQLVAYVVSAAGGGQPAPVRVAAEDEKRLLAGRRSFSLPNGMRVVQHDGRQARATYEEVFASDVYRRHGITYRDGDCIVDTGANTGFFTLFACQRCRPSKIVSVEPLPPNAELLRINAELHATGAEVVAAGVADRPGTAEFVFYPHASGLSTRAPNREDDLREVETYVRHHLRSGLGASDDRLPSSGEIEEALREHLASEVYDCRLTTISRIMAEHGLDRIDLLKMDVEKSEVLALAGIDEEDWPKIRQIIIEVHGSERLVEVRDLLAERGFELAVDQLMDLRGDGEDAVLQVYMLYARRPETREQRARDVAMEPLPAAFSPEVLRAHLRERLPEYMIPSLFVPLEALPLTPNGKVDRRALPAPTPVLRSQGVDHAPPRGEIERRLAAIWEELLGVERIGRGDNFFEVGGTSLLMVQVQQHLKRSLAQDISLVDLFRYPTVASLGARLSGAREGTRAAVEEGGRRGQRQADAPRESKLIERQRRFLEQRRARRGRTAGRR